MYILFITKFVIFVNIFNQVFAISSIKCYNNNVINVSASVKTLRGLGCKIKCCKTQEITKPLVFFMLSIIYILSFQCNLYREFFSNLHLEFFLALQF